MALTVIDALSSAPSPSFRVGLETKALTFAGLAPRLGTCAICGEHLDDPILSLPTALRIAIATRGVPR